MLFGVLQGQLVSLLKVVMCARMKRASLLGLKCKLQLEKFYDMWRWWVKNKYLSEVTRQSLASYDMEKKTEGRIHKNSCDHLTISRKLGKPLFSKLFLTLIVINLTKIIFVKNS
jgi:hypothetical protein